METNYDKFKHIKKAIDSFSRKEKLKAKKAKRNVEILDKTSNLLDGFLADQNDLEKIDSITSETLAVSGDVIQDYINQGETQNDDFITYSQINSLVETSLSEVLANSQEALFSTLGNSFKSQSLDIKSAKDALLKKLENYDFLHEFAQNTFDMIYDVPDDKPLKYNNIAVNLRELLREIFAELAPDEKI